MTHGRGHVIRAGAHRPLPFALSRHARLRATPRPLAVHLPSEVRAMGSSYEPYVLDQDGTGTCFACAPKIAIELTCARLGFPLPFLLSVLDLATLVHALERAADGVPTQPLWDWGGDPADVVTAISQWGVRPARYRSGTDEAARRCDASPATVGPDHEPGAGERGGKEPDFADLLTDAETVLPGAHELGEADPVEDLANALADGVAVTIAWRVLPADESAAPGTILEGRSGAPDHDSVIVGYRTVGGALQFCLQNSWGEGWADKGFAWVSEAFVRSASCRYAMSVRRPGGAS